MTVRLGNIHWGDVIHEASQEAIKATRIAMKQFGEDPTAKSGFCMIFVKGRKNDLYRYCKKYLRQYLHRKEGLVFTNPGRYTGHNPRVFEAGGRAFAEVLESYDVEVEIALRVPE